MQTFENAKNLFLLGLKQLEGGELQDAEQSFLESLKLLPNRDQPLITLLQRKLS
jgi:cytochrome c-type biogenesis protein CcmH/NrfG